MKKEINMRKGEEGKTMNEQSREMEYNKNWRGNER